VIGAGNGTRRVVAVFVVLAMLGSSLIGLIALRSMFSTDYCDRITVEGPQVPITCDSETGIVVVGGVPLRVPEVGQQAAASGEGDGFSRTVLVTRPTESRLNIAVVDTTVGGA
jgi:hypothetical protein